MSRPRCARWASRLPPAPATRPRCSRLRTGLLLLAGCALCGPAPGRAQGWDGGVPPGFEALMSEQESLIDVYYGGRLIATTKARFTPDEITLLEPQALTAAIPELLDPSAVEAALTSPVAANQAYICHQEGQSDCGVLRPEVVALIFDADTFRADLFINPDLLAVRTLEVARFQPPSDADWSFLQTFNYAFGGAGADIMENSNLFTLSALSYRENSLRLSANYQDSATFSVQSLYAQRDWWGKRYQAGYFLTTTQDLRFAPGTDLAGLRIGTSLDTRDDLRLSSGNALQVFLLSRGEVAIFKDGRLISAQLYDAGNQSIDTSALPGGSYNVDVRIRDSGGERFETRFYVKNSFLPPPDMPLYFFEFGEVTQQDPSSTLPQRSGQILARGGLNYRLNDANAIIGSLSGTRADTAAELGWFGLGRGYELRLTGALAQSSRYGASIDARLNAYGLYLTGAYRFVRDHSDRQFEDINLIGEAQEQTYLNVSAPTTFGRFSLDARYNDQPLAPGQRSFNLGYEANAWRMAAGELRLRFDLNRENALHQALITLQWRTYWGHWNATVTPQAVYREVDDASDSYLRGDANLNWDSQSQWAQEVRTNIRAIADRDFNAVGADVDWRGRLGQARYQIEQQSGDDDATLQNGSLATNFVVAQGKFAVGGKDQNQAAIVVDIEGSAGRDAQFDILIDGSRRLSATAGTRTVLSVRPFETYRVRLKATGAEFVHFDDREQTVSLYPGNVVYLSWNAAAVDILLGRIVDQDSGEPIPDALLHGVKGIAVTDEFGLFQAEIERGLKTITVKTRSGDCQVSLPPYQAHQNVGSVGVLRCKMEGPTPMGAHRME